VRIGISIYSVPRSRHGYLISLLVRAPELGPRALVEDRILRAPLRGSRRKSSSCPSRRWPPAVHPPCCFTTGPRFTGVDQGCEVLSRVETHRSTPPSVPVLLEVMNISSPSFRTTGNVSFALLLAHWKLKTPHCHCDYCQECQWHELSQFA
jgi:hypothetical protein